MICATEKRKLKPKAKRYNSNNNNYYHHRYSTHNDIEFGVYVDNSPPVVNHWQCRHMSWYKCVEDFYQGRV